MNDLSQIVEGYVKSIKLKVWQPIPGSIPYKKKALFQGYLLFLETADKEHFWCGQIPGKFRVGLKKGYKYLAVQKLNKIKF